MNWYDTIKRYYDMEIYNNDPSSPLYIGKFAEHGKITVEQYEEITGTVIAA